jgi:hypothetical protein
MMGTSGGPQRGALVLIDAGCGLRTPQAAPGVLALSA